MRSLLLTALLTLAFVGHMVGQTGNQIFRTVTVGTEQRPRRISLGAELTGLLDLLIKEGDSFKFERGFGGAGEIRVFLTNSARVKRIVFNYGGADFEKKLASYTESLGKPTSRPKFSSGILNLRMAIWEDADTRFELMEKMEGIETSVSSAMIDKRN